ncbi:hypothetical protein N431DRAFT_423591 [Stipitochalara longipes BDJ]|nr:hypothetical protein N431DRAFT_423591 [Stipitochalara longipes BDJ]
MQIYPLPRSKDSQREKKRSRKPHNKTKSGCTTCKKRRLKCGEEKPACLRCTRFGLQCEGYSILKVYSQRKNPSPEKALLPRNTSEAVITSSVSGGSSCSTPTKKTRISIDQALCSFPSAPRFKSPQEYRFHQLFCIKVADELSGFFPTNIWRHCVLQAAEAEPFIFDAVVAVGALHKIINDAPDLKDVEAHRRASHEHNFALERYQNSLGCMRKALVDGKMDARTALIACLLTVCFDNLYGNRGTAVFNMLSGVKLAKQIAQPTAKGAESAPTTNPTAASVEKELVAMFTRLDITSMVFIDHRPADEHRMMKDSLDQATEALPWVYSALEEAVCDGEMIMARCWHFIKILQEIGQKFLSFSDYFLKLKPDRWTTKSIRYGWNPWSDSDEPVPADWLAESERCVCEIEQWFAAFNPLVRKFQSSAAEYSTQLLRTKLVCLQAKFTLVSVRGAVYRREQEWDVHLSDFQEIVTLTETILAPQPKRFYTSFESDTLVIITYLICKCRDGFVRRRALRLLDDYPRREAAWDSRYCSKIGHWFMKIEEGGRGPLESTEIAEEQRLRAFALDYDSVEGSIRTWARQKTANGETVNHSLLWN